MKLAGVVILYNPEENIFENILTYLNGIDKLYVYDNSKERIKFIPKIIKEKSEYFHSGNNEGIAKRLNEALIASKKEGFDFLLTMDQDSSFFENEFNKYLSLLEKEENFENISMFGVRYYDLREKKNDFKYYDQLLITSGSILNLHIAKKLNGFDENIFIDGVDTDYCIRSFENGFKTVLFIQICLKHELGKTENKTHLFSRKKKKIKFHNPIRVYYILRNHLYLRRKHPRFRNFLKNKIIFNEIKNGFLYGGQPLKYFKFIVLAVLDHNMRRYKKITEKLKF